jgi:hypothetical protein
LVGSATVWTLSALIDRAQPLKDAEIGLTFVVAVAHGIAVTHVAGRLMASISPNWPGR